MSECDQAEANQMNFLVSLMRNICHWQGIGNLPFCIGGWVSVCVCVCVYLVVLYRASASLLWSCINNGVLKQCVMETKKAGDRMGEGYYSMSCFILKYPYTLPSFPPSFHMCVC